MRSSAEKPAPAWLWPNLLGLDAPAVAVAWQWLFASVFSIALPGIFHVILGLSVWCIYLADRLYDTVRNGDADAGTDRHQFTGRHFKPLAFALVFASALNLVLIIRHVPEKLIIHGLVTALLLGFYYAVRLRSGKGIASVIPREILCGMLFAMGTVIAPHAFATEGISEVGFHLPVLFFGLVCSMNCILISLWEKDADIASNDTSAATPGANIAPLIGKTLVALALSSVILSFLGAWQIYLSIAISAIALRIMLRFGEHIPSPALRVLADAALLTPLLFVWS